MDQVYQVLYGPNEDKLKHCGAAWLAISLLGNVAGSNLSGFVGLLAILAVVTKSEYLLFLFLVFGPLSLFITVVHIWKDPRTFWLFVVQIVYVVIQGLSTWFAWCQFQELNADSSEYQSTDRNTAHGQRVGHQDPFQSYVPPITQQNNYRQEEPRQVPTQPTQTTQNESQQDTKAENLI